ncbi:hypothetical protein D9756_010604 [Leucocoprinus leucothites]|uniref:Protein kinase domain-containing protein n=1 Tax=Leucocoprinus leucothites TaxID=201217 RepID=A0A8H5CT10_9AGAR|nr:hypothetical protein D9756_010604 [Leucoagaricus leucothites]
MLAAHRYIQTHDVSVSNDIIGYGSFSDVRLGEWQDSDHEEAKLAIKIFRQAKECNETTLIATFKRRLNSEISTWSRAQRHPNVLPFIGAYEHETGKLPALVSPYREAGDIHAYITTRNDYNRQPFVVGIADGLVHLHSYDIIHGDLKPKNILIHIGGDGMPTPEIADFGRSRILNVKGFTGSLHSTSRYAAPEVLNPPSREASSPLLGVPSEEDNKALTKESDVWSLGMVLLHVFSGKDPYPYLKDHQIVLAHERKEEPNEEHHPMPMSPSEIERVWPILRRCWELVKEPATRCSAKECADNLKALFNERAHN